MSRRPADGARHLRYVWLVYLSVLAFQPIFDESAGALDWIAVGALVGAFLPLYFATFRTRDDRRLLRLIVAMAALAFVGSLVNSGASVFVIYASGAAARLSPVRRAVRVIAALVGLIGLMVLVSPVPMPWRLAGFAPALVFTIVTGAANIVDAERERAHRRLLRADEEIERLATLAERERIARDLHDLLGHTLSVVVLKSELASRLVRVDPDRAEAEIHDIEQIGRQALGEVRAAVAGYRARGLGAEVEGARRTLEAAGVAVDVLVEDLPAMPVPHESTLALAVRESVTNIVRHADAGRATIRIGAQGDDVVLEVSDDGRGSAGAAEGAGLTGMRERVVGLGGSVVRTGGSVVRTGGSEDLADTGRHRGPGAGPGTGVRVTLPVVGAGDGVVAARDGVIGAGDGARGPEPAETSGGGR